MATEGTSAGDLFRDVDQYDWDNDQEFQGGLRAILGSANSPEQIAHLTLRARCFYYSRKFGTKVDFEGYQAYRRSHTSGTNGTAPDVEQPSSDGILSTASVETASNPGPHGNAPTPASFAEICQLIAEGKPIPGIKEIPDTVLEGQASASTAPKRKKPWEREPVPTPSAADEGLLQTVS
ncbi:hypothetical protein CAC42_5930 [Sphaceloma murrayae]|uniref:Uncharacterized protein n=1 Tax=Sphaceloma murrayae TaxID=2082308 RepID=A0A2K1QZN6_9PEZI|nr:hypothetical protein CAC42_5930 [Sphaceloma murrayae]